MKGMKLLFSIVLSLLLSCHRKADEIMVADYIIYERLTTNSDSASILHVLDTLLFHTKFKNKVQINSAYNESMINVYIIDGSLSYINEDNLLQKLVNNCAYAGANIIFLDDAYLRTFFANRQMVSNRRNIDLKEDQECLLYWVIGHEVGHLLSGHLNGHFEAGSLDGYVHNSSIDNREELQADSFFVHSITANTILRISVERLMLNMLNSEIEHKVGKVQTQGVGLIYDYTNEHIVEYARQPTHPEYVIRLSRMLELSSKRSGDKGLYNLIEGFIKQLKETR
jgi:hypothetical protein